MANNEFTALVKGPLKGLAKKEDYFRLIETVNGDWYGFEMNEDLNLQPMSAKEVKSLLEDLHTEVAQKKMHKVEFPYTYANKRVDPDLIKVYDPSRCGGSCSTASPSAWWIFTKERPDEEDLSGYFPRKESFFKRLSIFNS